MWKRQLICWAVWPDWTIFESSRQQICLQKKPKKIVDFWAILNISINVKTAAKILRQVVETFGQLFYLNVWSHCQPPKRHFNLLFVVCVKRPFWWETTTMATTLQSQTLAKIILLFCCCCFGFRCHNILKRRKATSVTSKKSPNVWKSCPKMISPEKLKI